MDFDEEDLVDSCDKLVENHQLVKPTTTALSQSKVCVLYIYYSVSFIWTVSFSLENVLIKTIVVVKKSSFLKSYIYLITIILFLIKV